MGQYVKAERLHERSLKIREKHLGSDHPDVAQSLNNLAVLYQAMGQYVKAEPLYERSLKIREKQLGPDHPFVAESLNNLAVLYQVMGQYVKAEPLNERSLKIREKQLGPDHPYVATSLNNLAGLYKSMGQYAKAELLYERSLKMSEKQLGPDHLSVATRLNNLAGLFQDMGQYAKAKPLYERSLKISEKQLGPDHPEVASALGNQARLYLDMGQFAKAEPLFERSLKIREMKLGPDHPYVAQALSYMSVFYASIGNIEKSFGFKIRERRVRTAHIQRTLPALSEKEQALFLKSQEGDRDAAFSLSLLQPQWASRSAPWLINGKSLALACVAERAQLARQSGDPAIDILFQRMIATQAQYASAVNATPKPGQEQARLEQIKLLEADYEDAQRKLGQTQGRSVRKESWVTLEEVQAALPADAVLLDFARFDVYDFKAKGQEKKWLPARYAVWITTKTDVQLIDLGPAEPIDAAILSARRACPLRRIQACGRSESLVRSRPETHRIQNSCLPPLASFSRCRAMARPVGCPTLVSNGAYCLEKHELNFLVSARDLVNTDYQAIATRQPALFANPDFDLAGPSSRPSLWPKPTA